jgi:hypothetical protein
MTAVSKFYFILRTLECHKGIVLEMNIVIEGL